MKKPLRFANLVMRYCLMPATPGIALARSSTMRPFTLPAFRSLGSLIGTCPVYRLYVRRLGQRHE